MTIQTVIYGALICMAFIWLMSRFLIVAIGNNDDLGEEVSSHE